MPKSLEVQENHTEIIIFQQIAMSKKQQWDVTCAAVGAAGLVRKVTGTPTPSSLSLEA